MQQMNTGEQKLSLTKACGGCPMERCGISHSKAVEKGQRRHTAKTGYRIGLVVCLSGFLMNLFTMLPQDDSSSDRFDNNRRLKRGHKKHLSSSIFSTTSWLEQRHGTPSAWVQSANHPHHPQHSQRLRVLLGILPIDSPRDPVFRKRHHRLFDLWSSNDPRVCSLSNFKSRSEVRVSQCQLVYTFFLGSSPDPLSHLTSESRSMSEGTAEEGKTQTWLAHASDIAHQYDFDYVAKWDSDHIFQLREFFEFAYMQLPPSPHNFRLFVGALQEGTPFSTTQAQQQNEISQESSSFFGNALETAHISVADQFYIMSTDLAEVAARKALTLQAACPGCFSNVPEVAFLHSSEPIKVIAVRPPNSVP